MPAGFNALFALTGSGLAGALTQVSGETATGSQQTTFNAMNQFMGVMTDPFIAGRGDPVGGGGSPNALCRRGSCLCRAAKRKPNDALAAIYTKAPPIVPSFEQRWSVWAAGFGGSQTHRRQYGRRLATTPRSSIYGTAVGADYRFSPNTMAGFALAGGGTNFSVANGLGGGRSDLFQAGAFIRHNVGAAYLTGALAYGWQDITTDRTVTVAGIDQLARAVQRQRLVRPPRRRLSLRRAMDRRRRHHALCRRAVHDVRSAGLCRAGDRRQPTRSRWPTPRRA